MIGSEPPALTDQNCPDCENTLYEVGSNRDLFCPDCRQKKEVSES